MRYIGIKLDSTPIQMEPVTIRQYNNLVDTVVVKLKNDMDGLVVEDYNVFVQTDLVRRDKIPLAPCRSSVDIVVEDGYLGYTWPIDSAVTRYKGILRFEVQLEHKTDVAIPIWQSEVCELITVAPNICDNAALGDDGPAILQEVYQQLQTLDDQAEQAAASAADASESKRLAATSAANAAASNQNAATHEQAAKDYADNAAQSNTAAGLSATAAGQAATQAGQSASDALESQNAAAISATDAAASNQNAATHEQAAKDYADAAEQSNTAAGLSATAAAEFAGLVSAAVNHRNIYRGKSLGSAVTDAQKAAISSGSFDDLFIGDYWTINSVKWVIADMDYWWHAGDSDFAIHHLVIVPALLLYSGVMNDTNITNGGYVGSKMYLSGLDDAKAKATAAFGSMVKTHREYLTNAVSNGYASAGAWYDSTVELMNEPMVYGSYLQTQANYGGNVGCRYTVDKTQLALFRLSPMAINIRQNYWLRDIVASASFALVHYYGGVSFANASSSYGVRPAFAIG